MSGESARERSKETMREFWDARAAEDALYFVDNRIPYRGESRERFWDGGEESLAYMQRELGLKIAPTDDVVEIGCGVGRITRALARRCRSVRAIDISEEMLARARELNPHLESVEWIQGDGVSLRPIPDASADGCYSDVVFQHIPDPEITLGYIDEICRVLRPGGWAAFQISNDARVHRRRPLGERLRSGARALLGRGPRGQHHPAWLGSAVDLDALTERANAGGADVERVANPGTQYCRVLLRRRG